MPVPFFSAVATRVSSILAGGFAAATGRQLSALFGDEPGAPRSVGVAGECGDGHREPLPYTRTVLTNVPIGATLARRMRVGRLRLPSEVAGLTPDDVPALAAVDTFADRLAELQLSQWLRVGQSLVGNAAARARRATAYAILEATIGDRDLAVAAWYVRDAIETSVYYASPPFYRWTKNERRAFAAAHAAAEEAALALLARSFLSSEDLDALCSPFAKFAEEAMALGR